MTIKRLIVILIVAGAAYVLYTQRGSFVRTAGRSPVSPSSPGANCIASAEMAYNKVSSAASLVTRPPVDSSAWQSAESSAASAISSAESACSSPADDKERQVADEVRSALASMRKPSMRRISALMRLLRGRGCGSTAASQPGD